MPCSLHSIATATRTTDSISFDQTEMKPATKFNTLNILWCTEKNSSNFQLTAALKLSEQFFRHHNCKFRFQQKDFLDFTKARNNAWQWHQLGHMQVCTSLQTDYHTSTPALCFSQAGYPSRHPTNSVKALKAIMKIIMDNRRKVNYTLHILQ